MQLFFEIGQAEQTLINVLRDALGFAVESTDIEVPDAFGFVQITDYEKGFNQGVLITWPLDSRILVDEDEVAKKIAVRLRTRILIEKESEDCWFQISLTGELAPAAVQLSESGVDIATVS
ncbi:hypothetical protein ACZ75_06330 [Massilia sp. NR 4-1]|nr:hypothetical protein ACZ75_06330 [Massilia sp. NR 4-1]